ncbi:MAG: guanylate kinase, partial [Planctomycetota bacterium]|nr:guanylate kinase [Planctomycetota bacterium]
MLIVLSAPSGAGKSTLARRLVERDAAAGFSVSYTTRPARPGERDGEHYHFVDADTFGRMIDEGAFLEWADVYRHRYGTGREATEQALGEGRDLVLDIDVQGARRIAEKMPEAVRVFVLPPDYETLEKRLVARDSDSMADQAHRLALAAREAMQYHAYDYLLVNDRLDEAFADLEAIVRAERRRAHRCRSEAETILHHFPRRS